jgi:hypothetical protein
MSVSYECVANKSHPRRDFVMLPTTPPVCCGRPMTAVAAVEPPTARTEFPLSQLLTGPGPHKKPGKVPSGR